MTQVIVTETGLVFAYPKIETDAKWALDATKLSPEVINYLFAYGTKQAVADRCSAIVKEPNETDAHFADRIKKAVDATLASLLDGSVRMGGGGGGARLSPLERHSREVFVEQLTRQGTKVGEARELQTEWRKVVLERQLARAKQTGGDLERAKRNAESIIKSITEEAQARVDRDSKVKIEL